MQNKARIFHGVRTQEGARVWAQTANAMLPLEPANNVRNHSPDGFEWGYGGSGPAQLALAITCNLLGAGRTDDALRVYQDVKWQFIAREGRDCWDLLAAEVEAFINNRLADYKVQDARREAHFLEDDRAGRPSDDARVRQAEGDAYGVDNEPT